MIYSSTTKILSLKIFFTILILFVFSRRIDAQQLISINQGSTKKDILILPVSFPTSYPSEYGFEDLDVVKTGKTPKKNAGFRVQLEKVAVKAAQFGGNVLQITRIEDLKQGNRYKFRGEVFESEKINEIKAKAEEKKKQKFSNGPCAYLTIYRPAYSEGFNDSIKYDITINDTLKLSMSSNSKYILRISKEGKTKISVQHKNFIQDLNVDVKMGVSYFVRNYVSFPGTHKYVTAGEYKVKLRGYTPYLEKIDDELQGEIESSMITQVVVNKKI